VLVLDNEDENRGQHRRNRKQEAHAYSSNSSSDACGVARSQRPQSATNNINQPQNENCKQMTAFETSNHEHLKPATSQH
jgi:hypothetical protein